MTGLTQARATDGRDGPSYDLAELGRLLSSTARAAMLQALMDGRARPAGELARCAGVTSSTASEHLTTLSSAGLVSSLNTGRHHYYRICDPTVAEALEALMLLTPLPPPRSLRASKAARSLALARTCYDHLAGEVGVAVHDVLVGRAWLVASPDGYDVTGAGACGLGALGVDVDAARHTRRSFARPCLDWTERRSHLAGGLAAALCDVVLSKGWLVRGELGRGLDLTVDGAEGLARTFGIRMGHPVSLG